MEYSLAYREPQGVVPPRYPALLRLCDGDRVSAASVAERLGITVREADMQLSRLVRMRYIRCVSIDTDRLFEITQAGSTVVDRITKKDGEFWLQAGPKYCHVGPEELADLRSISDRPRRVGACPVPSCAGTRSAVDSFDLEWVCLVCGLARLADSPEYADGSQQAGRSGIAE